MKMAKQKPITYEQSGVDIAAGEEFVKRIQGPMKSTHDKYVIPNPGGFAALYNIGARLRDEAEAEAEQEFKRDIRMTMKMIIKEYGEKRAPYVYAGHLLVYRANLINRIKLYTSGKFGKKEAQLVNKICEIPKGIWKK